MATYVGFFGQLEATLVKRGEGAERDRHNNPVLEPTGVTHLLTGCALQQRNTDETLDQRETTDTEWILFCAVPEAPELVTNIDLIQIDAAAAHVEPDPGEAFASFELDGNPDYLNHHAVGAAHHLELILRRVKL